MADRPRPQPEGSRRLFDTGGQRELFGEPSLEEEQMGTGSGLHRPSQGTPVECLGMTFATDDERRAYFRDRLREKLQDPEFRGQPGFPVGNDEDILQMSDPPCYTACPNPFLAEFVHQYGRTVDANDSYQVEPLAVDVSEGKTDPLYRAHGYHTKVPHLAIVPPILHYTQPGDLVLDGFAGSGMTGVAAQWCGVAPETYRQSIEARFQAEGRPLPTWGARRVVLNDLSPAATFMAANYNLPFDVEAFGRAARDLLREIEHELEWMYETRHTDGTTGQIDFTVWSEVFACPDCSDEVIFLHEALDPDTKHVREDFPCPHCGLTLSKDKLQRVKENLLDPATREVYTRIKLVPALVQYVVGKKRFEKLPDAQDLATLERVANLPLPASVPTGPLPISQMAHGSRLAPKGFTRVNHLFLPRQAQALGALWAKAAAHSDPRIRSMLLYTVEQAIWGMSVLT